MSSCDAKESARCERVIELRTNDVCSIEKNMERATTSKCRSYLQIVDSNQDSHQCRKGDDSTETCDAAIETQNDDKVVESLHLEVAKIRKLKMIVRKTYPEDRSRLNTFSRSIVTCLSLPCKPNDLIRRIFEDDPSLTETCLIVMKRKFLMSVYNVCSCLNDILGKLDDVEFARTSHLNCDIHPGYIGFRLKGKVNKFIARIPICQNVRRRTIQQSSVISTCRSKLSSDAEEGSKYPDQRDDDGDNFNDTLSCVDEESEEMDDTCCSQSNRNIKDTIMTRDEYLQDLTILSCKKSREIIAEETCDATSHVDNSEQKEKCHEISMELYCEKNDTERECRGKIFDSSFASENLVETNREMENISSDKEPPKCDCQTRSSNKEPNLEDEDCNANTCSIASFVQDSERDKQLVELNYNRFLDNDISAIDEQRLGDDGSLNSARTKIGRDPASHRDDFTDITDSIPGVIVCAFETSRDDLDVISVKTRRKHSSEDSLTVSVQTSRLRVSSKGINVNVSYPRTVVCSTSGEDDASLSAKTRDVEVANPLIVSREILRNKKVSDKTRGFIQPSRRSPVSRSGLRSNGDSKSFDISEEEHLCATSNPSRCCRSTSKFIASEFEESRKSRRRLSKLSVNSSNGFRSVTSFTTIKCGTASRKDYSAKIRSQAILVMAKFRNSIDRSVDRIKRLIHARLRKILFNDGSKTNVFWKNEETSEDTTRVRTSGRCVRQVHTL